MKYQTVIDRTVLKQIKKFEKKTQVKIFAAIENLADNPRPPGFKKLVDAGGLYRIVVGNYRVIYLVADDVLIVTVVKTAKRDEKTY
jgi:mRNA interferase RelE/StbE